MVTILLLSLVDYEKKYKRFAGHFDYHVDAPVRCGAHRLIEHDQGFMESH